MAMPPARAPAAATPANENAVANSIGRDGMLLLAILFLEFLVWTSEYELCLKVDPWSLYS
jgi:hypothetical protein